MARGLRNVHVCMENTYTSMRVCTHTSIIMYLTASTLYIYIYLFFAFQSTDSRSDAAYQNMHIIKCLRISDGGCMFSATPSDRPAKKSALPRAWAHGPGGGEQPRRFTRPTQGSKKAVSMTSNPHKAPRESPRRGKNEAKWVSRICVSTPWNRTCLANMAASSEPNMMILGPMVAQRRPTRGKDASSCCRGMADSHRTR